MIRHRTWTRFVFLSGIAIVVAGCQEWADLGFQQEPGPGPVAVEPGPAEEPAPGADMADETPADPHHEETVAQVMNFIDRLNNRDAGAETTADQSAEPASPPPGSTQLQAAQPPQRIARANEPLDVTALPEPQPGDADQSVVKLPEKPIIESVFIRTGTEVETADPPAEAASAANNPLSTDPPMRALTVDQMLEALNTRVAESPDDTAALWELRMLQLAVGDDQAAREVPEGLSTEYAALLRGVIDVIVAGRAALDNPVTASDAALQAVDDLRNVLRERADLLIPTVALCTRVQAFGVYDELASDALAAHQPNRAIVYVEIGNFMSEKTGDGRYRTALADELEVLTASGQSLWRHEEPEIIDLSRQQREDFFLAQMITLPATLGPGEYVLKVTIQDALSGKSNQSILPFTLGSTSVAAAGY